MTQDAADPSAAELPDTESLAAGIPVTDIVARSTVRLIPTAYAKPPVLGPLADSDDDMAALAELEGLTNRRQLGQNGGLADLDTRELAFRARAEAMQRWGHTHINAAFLYTREGGSRFNDEDRGAWYCAFDNQTALNEVGFHRTRELRFINRFEDQASYQALLADFIGPFPDLRGVDPVPDCLHADTQIGYPAGQDLARKLRAQDHAGLLYPSVRHPGGHCFAAFAPQIVQNVRPGAKWLMEWTGSPEYSVTESAD